MNVSAAERNARTQYFLFGVFFLLVVLGILCVASASYYHAGHHEDSDFNQGYYIVRQAQWALAALAVYAICSSISSRRWKFLAPAVFVLTFGLSLLVFTPLGVEDRWVRVGPILFQPSEFLKCGLIVALAWYLPRTKSSTQSIAGFLKGLAWVGACALLVMAQGDLGTTLIVLLIGVGMLAVANVRVTHLLALGCLLVLLLGLAVKLEPYRLNRIPAWTHPWANAKGVAKQTVHALHAIGAGGLKGVGIGQGLEKYHLPEAPHTDFVFATVAEETGIVGPALIMALYIALATLGVQIALLSRDPFGRLAAMGGVIFLCGQAALNIAVATNTVPCTGIPLPFISYGGSSMVAGAVVFGLLSSLSKGTVRRVKEAADESYGDGGGDGWSHFSGPGGDFGASSPGVRGRDLVRR